ncbi:MAG TPA: DNA methyltransferase [Vicinamibacterales bacterium]|nr:DNA methyltransferase [Vicinamibacterales bacterium]
MVPVEVSISDEVPSKILADVVCPTAEAVTGWGVQPNSDVPIGADVRRAAKATIPAGQLNRLYCGDNIDVLRKEIKDESVDLVYLDPPFKSDQNYNVIYREQDGRKAAAQQRAFEDTWEWNQASKETYERTIEGGGRIADAIRAFFSFLGPTPLMAYLAMMAPRLIELRRVLKPSGTLYLHCDPNASHYLKTLLDAVFGHDNFSNEMIWRRTTTKNDYKQGAVNWPRVHDVLLMYYKSTGAARTAKRFAQPFVPYDSDHIKTFYNFRDADGRQYRLSDLTAPGQGTRGHPKYEFLGVTRYWRYNKEKMERLHKAGRVEFRPNGRVPRLKVYLDEAPGVAVGDVWTDIRGMINLGKEMLGYPTQKPEALLERILKASSNEGDVVLDPFCGCGTAIAVSQRLNRTWIGIDITHLAIGVIRGRLHNNGVSPDAYGTHWVPATVDEAVELAGSDPFQFQCWILGELGINPLHQKRGADRGIDGRLFFFDGPDTSKPKQLIFSVKSGGITPAYVRELVGVVKRERAQIGVLVTLEDPSVAMKKEAAAADVYRSHDDNLYPGIQILTVADILAGKRPQLPASRTLSFPDPKMLKVALATEQQQELKFG